MSVVLTADGSFAKAFLATTDAEIVSSRELSEKEFQNRLASADTIIHNASTLKSDDISTAVKQNFEFTKQLVELVKSLNPSAHLILLSSMSILDSKNDQVYAEVLEMSPYAYSKYLAETYCLKSDLHHLSCVRFSTLFYHDFQKDGLSKLIFEAVKTGKITLINDGEAKRDFLPIDIAAQYVNKIVLLTTKANKIYNLVSGEPRSFYEIADILSKKIPDLEVNNTELPESSPVLSTFNADGINSLGRINFSLDDSIARYITELNK